MVQTKSSKPYQLKGNQAVNVPVPIVGNLIYDELGQLALAKFNERFRGINDIEYESFPKEGWSVSFSNVPRALGLNQILMEETNGNIRVLSPLEVVRYWDSIPNRSETYADTNAVSLFQKEGSNEELRKRALEIIGKDSKDLTNPLLVLNLGVEPSDNEFGFTFTETPYTQAVEAPFLTQDQRVKYDAKKKTLASSKDRDGIQLWVPSLQSGLMGFYQSRLDGLYARYDDLLGSDWGGRIRLVQDPQVAPKI